MVCVCIVCEVKLALRLTGSIQFDKVGLSIRKLCFLGMGQFRLFLNLENSLGSEMQSYPRMLPLPGGAL